MVKVTRSNSAPDLNKVREELERKRLEAEKLVLELERQETQSAPSSPSHDDLVQQLSTRAQEFEELATSIQSEKSSSPAAEILSPEKSTKDRVTISPKQQFKLVVDQLNHRVGVENSAENEKTSSHGFFSFLPSASAFLSMTVDFLKTMAMAAVILAAGAAMGATTAMSLGGSIALGAGIGAATGAAGLGCAHLVDSGFSFFGSSKPGQPEQSADPDMEPQLVS